MSRTKNNPAVSTWKTKEVEGRRLMICQNSDLDRSKWADFGPEWGECDEWSEVGNDTTASLCYRCTSRSVSGIK